MVMPWFMAAPWCPKFKGAGGTNSFGEWRIQVQAILRAQRLSAPQQVDFIMNALEGDAKREVLLMELVEEASATDIFKQLETLYGDKTSLAQIRVRFFKCRQGAEEGPGAFTLRLRELFARWRKEEPTGSARGEYTLRD